MSTDDPFSQFSLFDLFQQEAETQCALLTEGLLALERDPADAARLEALMRAAHSLKGAARIVGLDTAVRVAHAMEDCFVAAQSGAIVLHEEATDRLLKSNDLLRQIASTPEAEMASWQMGESERSASVEQAIRSVLEIIRCELPAAAESSPSEKTPSSPAPSPVEIPPAPSPSPSPVEPARDDRILRVSASNLNRLLGLAGESLVESRWLQPYAESLLRLKRQHWHLLKNLEILREALADVDASSQTRLAEAMQLADGCLQGLSDRHAELELFSRRSANLSHRLYNEALASRMRPFADGVHGFPRLVRDLARTLGKEVKLEIAGESTAVDRDVLEKLEAPLNHLLRNAVDHGLELPTERERAGKPREGLLRLEARHVSGQLQIIIEDDGRGIPLEGLRAAVVEKKLTTAEIAGQLSEEELLEFLFLPGFSMREAVTEISGRGVGLDAVQNMAKTVGGSVRATTTPGRGTRFQIHLPLTLSVIRALLVEVAGEPYAFPLVRIRSAIQLPREQIETLEGKEHAPFGGQQIGLVAANQLFGKETSPPQEILPVVVIGERGQCFGVAVDAFLGERQLVVQPLDRRLGKIKDISAGALMPDGSPVLIVDVDDLLRSIETLASGGGMSKLRTQNAARGGHRRKRILVVDDSLTVRELERKLLSDAGYEVEAAVDGMDGWNAVRTQAYDLVVTDIDMPRLDGIELVRLIKNEPRVKSIPVMIVSYKDRPEDRHRGLEAGADYYLTKGSFHDETLLHAVADLIGKADET